MVLMVTQATADTLAAAVETAAAELLTEQGAPVAKPPEVLTPQIAGLRALDALLGVTVEIQPPPKPPRGQT